LCGTGAVTTGEERSKWIFAIVGASSGNLVEWFDFLPKQAKYLHHDL